MKYQASFDTPEEIQTVVNVIENNGGTDVSLSSNTVTFTIGSDNEYDLGSIVRNIQNDLVDEANIYVEIDKPKPIDPEPSVVEETTDEQVSLVNLVKELSAKTDVEAKALVKELKALHTAIEDKLKRLAIDHELFISLGDYGYGRSIDGSDWNSSGCEWETSSEPDWQSSSYGC